MWSTLSDNLTTGIAALTGLAALFGAWLKLKPRRFIGWLAAVKEREALLAMLEHERKSGMYWRQQAQECIREFQQEINQDAINEAQWLGSPVGGGRGSSPSGAGLTPRERSTG